MVKMKKFITNYIEDIFIMLGILLIVAATFIIYGLGISMLTLGVFLVILGVVDVHYLRK